MLNSSRINGKIICGEPSSTSRIGSYLGVITRKTEVREVWEPFCTASLISKNIAVSAGFCLTLIGKKSELYKNFKVHFRKTMNVYNNSIAYSIEKLYRHYDYMRQHGDLKETLDIGLILVS